MAALAEKFQKLLEVDRQTDLFSTVIEHAAKKEGEIRHSVPRKSRYHVLMSDGEGDDDDHATADRDGLRGLDGDHGDCAVDEGVGGHRNSDHDGDGHACDGGSPCHDSSAGADDGEPAEKELDINDDVDDAEGAVL